MVCCLVKKKKRGRILRPSEQRVQFMRGVGNGRRLARLHLDSGSWLQWMCDPLDIFIVSQTVEDMYCSRFLWLDDPACSHWQNPSIVA